MNSGSAIAAAVLYPAEVINMKTLIKKIKTVHFGNTLLFVPFIIMGGRLVFRVIMNTWNMIEG